MKLKSITIVLMLLILVWACKDDKSTNQIQSNIAKMIIPEPVEFGFKLNDFVVKKDTVQNGDSFGEIMQRNRIGYGKIFEIAEKTKDSFDITKLKAGKPYTLLCAKDSLETPKYFVYQPSEEDYVVVNLADSIGAYTETKPIKYVERVFTGTIEDNISFTLKDKGISQKLAYILADDIYAWTIDFRRLQKGDRFKVIYTDKYIDDSTYVGVHEVKAALFEHRNDSIYAFAFETDSINNTIDFFTEDAKQLRSTFLKMPVKFGRLSSRYNLNRRIAYYGYKVRPHKGTDFAAPIGTPILATANGTVVESTRRGGNGKFVKIKHNDTYSTQYLHMKAQNVKKGDYVKQGDVIGWIGMTGNSGGPHVCYRFWKNGKQVDPLKLKLPESEPISDSLKVKYLEFMKPVKARLDQIPFESTEPKIELEIDTLAQIQ